MQKLWSILFLIVILFAVGTFLIAPAQGWWLPENFSSFGQRIDGLFYLILAITGITFVATQAVLIYVMYRYRGSPEGKGEYIHGSHRLEMAWTIVPAGILLFIALFQMGTWAEVKMNPGITGEAPEQQWAAGRRHRGRLVAEIEAHQFGWRVRYTGLDGEPGAAGVDDDRDGRIDNIAEMLYPATDDFELVNELVVPMVTEPDDGIVISLTTADVLHSFFLPHLRIKQDAVPGRHIPVWFAATEEGEFPLVCAELCGWGHYKMRGRLTVLRRTEFMQWLETTWLQQHATGAPQETDEAVE